MKLFYFIALLVLVLDQLTKMAVAHLMFIGQTVAIWEGIFHITYVRNHGAAFGILPGQRWFFIVVALAVVVLILLYARSFKDNRLLQVAFALQLGGAAGNLVDRLFRTGVVDFLDFQVWPVFNIADTAIVVGVALFAIDVIWEWKRQGNEG